MLSVLSGAVTQTNLFLFIPRIILMLGFVLATVALAEKNRRPWEILGAVLLAIPLGALIFDKSRPLLDGRLREIWKADRNAFIQRVNGFPALRQLARDQYGLDLELAPFTNGYLATTHIGPGSSVGVMTLFPGYCQLSLWPEGTAVSFAPYSGEPELPHDRRIEGIALHELGHCVDMSRDQPSFKDPSSFGTRSIAPGDRAAVVDVHSFAQAQMIPRTQLWQETYADLFAIGMIRLTWPQKDAHAFVVMLRHTRHDTATEDAIHATSCWLDTAQAAAAPATTADVAGWADHLRDTASCRTDVPTKPDDADLLPAV